MINAMEAESQLDRFRKRSPAKVTLCLEMAPFDSCDIYSVCEPIQYLEQSVANLSIEVDGRFIVASEDENRLRDELDEVIPSLAEFVVWDLLTNSLNEFDRKYAQNGRLSQWFSKGSPSFIDMYAIRHSDNGWRFHVVEVKWSEKCDYARQIRQGLVEDLKKLFSAQYAHERLGQHISSLKNILRPHVGDRGIEEMFSSIEAGESPKDTTGVEFWGVFVSDWALAADSNPDKYFARFLEEAERNGWAKGTVRGLMLNIPDGQQTMTNLALGRIICI